MKNYFFGKYYKCISLDGFSFAVIISYSDEGPELQLITKEKAYFIKDKSCIKDDNGILNFNVEETGLTFKGKIELGKLNPLKKKVMGPFSIFKMQCSHNIYSMFHSLSGEIEYNGKIHNFDNGYGYIEGDEGNSFPSKYIWYNSVKKDCGVTLAIATIPFGFINFIGLLCFVKTSQKEYYLCTYNFAKVKKTSSKQIIIKKGKLKFQIDVLDEGGHLLKAPNKGMMDRYIKENVCIKTKYKFTKKNDVLIEYEDDLSSFEYMFD